MCNWEEIYKRLYGVKYIGKEGLERLQRKKALIWGVGNIGGQVAYHLGLLGMKNLTLVDRGLVEKENLGTQGFEISDIGVPKVYARARRLKAINPDCTIVPIHNDVRDLGMGILKEMDLALCCLDSFADRIYINECATRMGTPWIDAAIDGSGQWLYGKTAVYTPAAEDGPCYLCQWNGTMLHSAIQAEKKLINHQGKRGCADWRWLIERGTISPPTLQTSSLGGVIAGLQTTLAVNMLLNGSGLDIYGIELSVNLSGRPYSMKENRLKRNRYCLFDHKTYGDLLHVEGDLNIGQIFEMAEDRIGGDIILQLHGRELIGRLICPQCRSKRILWKISGFIEKGEIICQCGSEMRASARNVLSHFSREDASPILYKKFHEIGLPPNDVITASNGEKEIHLMLGGKGQEGLRDAGWNF